MKIGAIVQARMSSKRFPHKVLNEVDGEPLLQYLIERIKLCSKLDHIVVATSTDKSDQEIYNFCEKNGYACYRGSLNNVASRFYELAIEYSLDVIVRLNADSPLLDHMLIELAIQHFLRENCDLVTNTFPRSFPKGQSVEVINVKKFLNAYLSYNNEDEYEHVTFHFYNHPNQYKIYNFSFEKDLRTIQLSVDTPEDLEVFKQIISKMNRPHWEYNLEEILSIYSFIQ